MKELSDSKKPIINGFSERQVTSLYKVGDKSTLSKGQGGETDQLLLKLNSKLNSISESLNVVSYYAQSIKADAMRQQNSSPKIKLVQGLRPEVVSNQVSEEGNREFSHQE